MIKPNEGLIDRTVRVAIGSLALIAGGFWLGGISQQIVIIVGILMSITGFIGFCGLYALLKKQTCMRDEKPPSTKQIVLLIVLYLLILGFGGFISNTITKKKFLEEYGKMNSYYKQTLFLTGQNRRQEAIKNYELWKSEFETFKRTYNMYRPIVIRNDTSFTHDLTTVSTIIDSARTGIYSGDLQITHTKLEAVRPLFQAFFKRNGFSMLSLLLTDFHDAMEKVIEAADAQDSALVIQSYNDANRILTQIEKETNSIDVQTIRENLDQLVQLAKGDKKEFMSKKAKELKSSFVKVYLKQG